MSKQVDLDKIYEGKIEANGNYLYGYCRKKTLYETFLIENTPEQIAAFIMKFRWGNVSIHNALNSQIIRTQMGDLDYCQDQAYLPKLLQVLVPMQRHEVDPIEFTPYELNSGEDAVGYHKEVELDGLKFEIIITDRPVNYIHILNINAEDSETILSMVPHDWCGNLLKKLDLSVDVDHFYYYFYLGDNHIYEYVPLYDDSLIEVQEQFRTDATIWFPFKKVIEERNE